MLGIASSGTRAARQSVVTRNCSIDASTYASRRNQKLQQLDAVSITQSTVAADDLDIHSGDALLTFRKEKSTLVTQDVGDYAPKVFSSVCDLFVPRALLINEYGSTLFVRGINFIHKQLALAGLAKGNLNFQALLQGQTVSPPASQVAGVTASTNYGKITWNVGDSLVVTVVPGYRDVRIQGESVTKLVPLFVPVQFDVVFPSKMRMSHYWDVNDSRGMIYQVPRLFPSKLKQNEPEQPAETILNATINADVNDYNMALEAFVRLIGMHAIDLYRAKTIDYLKRNDRNGFRIFATAPTAIIVGLQASRSQEEDAELKFTRDVTTNILNQPTWPNQTYFSKALLRLCVGYKSMNECRSVGAFANKIEFAGMEALMEGMVNAFKSVQQRHAGVALSYTTQGKQGGIHIRN